MDEFEKNQLAVDEAVETVETEEIQEETIEVQSAETETVDAQTEKKTKVQKPIIIAACILLVAILGFVCFRVFFNNSVVGTWVIENDATSDEASDADSNIIYYTFDKDGNAYLTTGTMKVAGTWDYVDTQGATSDQMSDKFKVQISYFFNGTFDYQVIGNEITGRKMVLNDGNQEYNFVSKSIPKADLKPAEDFKAEPKLVGTWKNTEYNLSYVFNEDGTCHINQMDQLYLDGVYTVADGKVDITYLAQGVTKTSIDYIIDGDKITISGVEYKKTK